MIVTRRRNAERLREQELARGGAQQVASAHHLGDAHRIVVGDDGELIGGNVITPPDDEVAEIIARCEVLLAEMQIAEGDGAALRHAEAPVVAARIVGGGSDATIAASAWIVRFVIGGSGRVRCLMRGLRGLRQIFARARAGVNSAGIAQLLPRLQINIAALALGIRRVRAADIRAFPPLDAEPAQVFEVRVYEFAARALRVEIFVAQEERAAGVARALNAVQNVRAWPRCSRPVGEGAMRPR